MLEIKNLTKIYKTKGGADVKALDNVSINFEETGLVFLLGKSGSGKSTLLNLAGGLDEPTSGEVIVMGKSSKDFSGSDFDSYRNTFIGFVFQEYNVLNEFNVEENIALALELQGKTKNRDKVKEILEEVELGNFAKRKPNTLSGGQKQRIAIARALVKDPQIIMADEPTGALDSGTGRQVFDTLKQLSKTRLVIVVSHDREFAEVYGDRIVELKDGKIISDVIKVKDEASCLSENIAKIGENTLAIRKGTKLDDAAIEQIREFLSGESDVIISKGEKEVANFKRVNRIDDAGAQERFDVTDESKLDIKKYDGSAKFIRSRLPASKAIRIGAAGLKLKPIRLIFTILLSFVSFVMFGLFSTMMLYDSNTVLINSFRDSDYDYVMLTKQYHSIVTTYFGDGDSYDYEEYDVALMTPADVDKYGQDATGVYFANMSISNLGSAQGDNYYIPLINYLTVLTEDHPLRDKIINGDYPEKNEIAISSYLADCIINGLFYPIGEDGKMDNQLKSIESYDKIIGEKLSVRGETLTVSGIFDSGEIPSKYDEIKDTSSLNQTLQWQFRTYIGEGFHSLAFVDQTLADSMGSSGIGGMYVQHFDFSDKLFYFLNPSDTEQRIYEGTQVKVYDEADKTQYPIFRLDNKSGALKDDELIVSIDYALTRKDKEIYKLIGETDVRYQEINDELKNLGDETTQLDNAINELNNYLDSLSSDDEKAEAQKQLADLEKQRSELEKEISEISEQLTLLDATRAMLYEASAEISKNRQIFMGNIWDDGAENSRKPTETELTDAIEFVKQLYPEPIVDTLYSAQNMYMSGTGTPMSEYKIVGFYYNTDEGYVDTGFYCSQAFYDEAGVYQREIKQTNYVAESDAIFYGVLAPLSKDSAALENFFAGINVLDKTTDTRYILSNSLFESVQLVDSMMEAFSVVFLILGIVLAVFSSLLLFNFISMSITNKKKEIGILRAVGARGTDVFKIFFAESGIIVGICLVLALIGTVMGTNMLNNVMKAEAGLAVTLFNFGPLSIAIMVGVALVVAFAATFLPVFFAARKKPVESIRAL